MARTLDEIFGNNRGDNNSGRRTLEDIFAPPQASKIPEFIMSKEKLLPPSHTPVLDRLKPRTGIAGDVFSGIEKSGVPSLIGKAAGNIGLDGVANRAKQLEDAYAGYDAKGIIGNLAEMAGEQLPLLPLWALGAGGARLLGGAAVSKMPAAGKISSKLPGIVKGGLEDAAAYATTVAPAEAAIRSINDTGNLSRFGSELLQREKQVPLMGAGGVAVRGALKIGGKALGKLTEGSSWGNIGELVGEIRTGKLPELPPVSSAISKATISSATGPLKVVTPEQKALTKLQEGIEIVQNHYGHNDILAPFPAGTTLEKAFTMIKAETGVDLPKLTANLERASVNAKSVAEMFPADKAKLARVAGVRPGPGDVTLRRPTPEFEPRAEIESPMPKARIEAPFESPIPKGTAIEEAIAREVPNVLEVKGEPRPPEPAKPSWVERISTEADEQAEAARKRIAANKGRAMSGIPVDTLADYAIIGAAHLTKGVIKYSAWAAEMVKEFGNDIKPHLRAIYEKSKEFHRGWRVSIPESSKEWKDKGKFFLQRETPERIFEDVMGKDAPEMIDMYVTPVKTAEAQSVRWKNRIKDEVRSLGLTRNEGRLLQKFGEGQVVEVNKKTGEVLSVTQYTIDDLKRDAPNSWQKIQSTVDRFRKIYNDARELANAELIKYGYDPIPFRENYFPHMDELGNLLEQYGIPVKDDLLPTEISGLTADLKPGKTWFAHELRRKGIATDYDALRGMDKYLNGIANVIFHTGNIQRLRGLDKLIREQYAGTKHLANFVAELTEYTNGIAGKKTFPDRGMESRWGRKVYGTIQWAKKQVSSNMLGFNVSAAMTQGIPLTQIVATTEKKAVLQAAAQTLGNKWNQIVNSVDDGFINRSDFLTRRKMSDDLVKNPWQKIQDAGFWGFKVIDDIVSQIVVRSKYNEGINKGLAEDQAMKIANDWAARIMADRSRGSMPTMFRDKASWESLLMQFQLEVNNQMSFMFKDVPRSQGGKKLATASVLAQLFIYDYAFNWVFEKITGRRPAFDPIWVAQKAIEDFNNPDMESKGAVGRLAKNTADQLPFSSFFTGGRIPLESGLPKVWDVVTGEASLSKEALKLPMLISPTGANQIKKTWEGVNALSDKGVYSKSGNLMFPVEASPGNLLRGPLLGKSSFPESAEYWDKMRRPLGEKQTETMKKANNSIQVYERIMKERERQRQLDKSKK